MGWLGLDIGGANIKVADGHGYAASAYFPLWERPDELHLALSEQIARAPAAERLAVTMTGELADCFETKAEGVAAILDAVERAAEGRKVLVYLCNGEFATPQAARENALLAAASNWYALAAFAVRFCEGKPGLLIDIGSTTTDLIALQPSGPDAMGRTDPERLVTGELVYTGVRRSPVCALVNELPWRGQSCGVAQELFATTADVFLVLGDLEEDSSDRNTADGRPLTRNCSRSRLARTICADKTMFSPEDAEHVATAVQTIQLELLASAFRKVLGRLETKPSTIVISGAGEFLGRRLVELLGIEATIVSLNGKLGPEASTAATAHALALLAQEKLK